MFYSTGPRLEPQVTERGNFEQTSLLTKLE
jgi:hypothetical protein